MSLSRFAATEPALSDLAATASVSSLRRAARRAAQWAMDANPAVQSTVVLYAVKLLGLEQYGDSPTRVQVGEAFDRLDQEAWNIAQTDALQYIRLFVEARALNSLWYALDADARVAAEGAMYEAIHAEMDPSKLRESLALELSSSQVGGVPG